MDLEDERLQVGNFGQVAGLLAFQHLPQPSALPLMDDSLSFANEIGQPDALLAAAPVPPVHPSPGPMMPPSAPPGPGGKPGPYGIVTGTP